MKKLHKVKLVLDLLVDKIGKKISFQNNLKPNTIVLNNYTKVSRNNRDPYDELIETGDLSVPLNQSQGECLNRDITSLIRNPNKHEEITKELFNMVTSTRYIKSKKELDNYYNSGEFITMKIRNDNHQATSEEQKIVNLAKKFSILPVVTVEKYEDQGGERILTQKGGVKAIGIVFPTAQMFNFDFKEVFYINGNVVDEIWGSKGVNFSSDNTAQENLIHLLNYMENDKISDLHFKLYDETTYSYTARQKTKLIKVGEGFGDIETTQNLINQVLHKAQRDTKKIGGEEIRGLMVHTLNNGVTRNFRLHSIESTFNNTRGFSISLRRLPREEELETLEGLKYMTEAANVMRNVLKKNRDGLILVSGATNSGKTTLLNSILLYIRDELNRRIHRIENPAEVALKDVTTIDLMDRATSKNPMTVKKAIKAIFSQDPDVALIGEARDESELLASFELARTGHLALVTVHANNNAAAISRFADLDGLNKNDLNDKLRMAINQHLVIKICPHCKNDDVNEKKICTYCGGSKSIDVLPVYEITVYFNLEPTDDLYNVKKLVEEKKCIHFSKDSVLEIYKKNGWIEDNSYNDFVYNIEDLKNDS